MRSLFLWFCLLALPLFADMREALHPDDFDQSHWTDGEERLAFFTVRPRSPRESISYRYGMAKKDDSVERGSWLLDYAWRQEMPYAQNGVPVTNYFYQLTLHPNGKTPRTAIIRFVFTGERLAPDAFEDVKYKKLWQRVELTQGG